MKKQHIIFLVISILMLVNTVVFNVSYIQSREFPEYIIFLGISIMSFCLAYTSEHFVGSDERSKKIRERSMYISFFWVLGASFLLLLMMNPSVNLIALSAYHLLLAFLTYYISIVSLSFVYYSMKY